VQNAARNKLHFRELSNFLGDVELGESPLRKRTNHTNEAGDLAAEQSQRQWHELCH
jgi:hypothetical protein